MNEKMFIIIFSKEAYGEIFVRPDVCHDPPRTFVGMQHDTNSQILKAAEHGTGLCKS